MFNPEYGMPYETDVNSYETEEERRRRLALEQEQNTPVKQTITTDPVTGAQKVKIEGSAYNLSAANPATPTVSAPVDPADIYSRMIQAESGGRQFAPNGQVLTSPKGAMGVGQVMPATAMQPGYGVPNIFDMAQQRGMPVAQRDEATAKQLLGNEQLNRDFGQNYFNAMQQRFPGDPAASVAAYNAGPGRVGQNMQANAGQLNRGQLPAETQAYLQQTLGGQPQPVSAPAPAPASAAQPIINDQGQILGYETPDQIAAGIATNAPVAQAPVPTTGAVSPEMMRTQAPVTATPATQQMGPPTSAMTPEGWVGRFNSAKNDLGTLTNMLADPNLPPGARMEIAATMADQMRFQKQEAEAKDKTLKSLESGNMRELERQDKKMGGEGSWLRYIVYGLLGSPNAQLEKDKLFPEMSATTQTFIMDDGKTTGYMSIAKDGTPLRGGTEDGRQLTQKELIKYASLQVPKGSQVGTTTFTDPGTGETLTKVDTTSGAIWFNKARQRVIPKGEPIPNTIGGNLEVQSNLANLRIRENIIKKGITNIQDAKKEYILQNGPFGSAKNPMSETDFDAVFSGQLRALNMAPSAGTTAPTTAAPTTAAPTTPPPSGAVAPGATLPSATTNTAATPTAGSQFVTKTEQKARDEIVKNSADVLKDESTMISQINSGNTAIDVLDNKKTNFGSILQGQIPGEQTVGKILGTQDARNTQKVMEYLDKVTAAGAKALGANPTDRDLKFLLENRPNEKWPAEDVKTWITSTQERIRDNIEIARKQVQSGGTYQPPVPTPGGSSNKPSGVKGGSGTKEDPYKL
jgi:hypothetical protein